MNRVSFTLVVVIFGIAPLLLAAPVPKSDPLLIGTKWKGKLTQRGTFASGGMGPPEFAAVLTITKRDRNAFEGELYEVSDSASLRITYLVKGEIKHDVKEKVYVVAFKSYEAKDAVNTVPILGIPYRATLTNRTMKGKWRIPKNDNGIDIEGDFTLELRK